MATKKKVEKVEAPAKKDAAKAKGKTGHRLTAEQKQEIAAAGPDTTNKELAEKYETSAQTIANYRTTAAARGRKAATTGASPTMKASKQPQGGIMMDSEGDYIVLKVHKSRQNVVQGLVNQLLLS